MIEWFNSLDPMLRIYWGIALIASLVFVIQMIVSFVGGDVFDDADFDSDHDAGEISHFFSVRNLVNFLLGAGWGGVCFYNSVSPKAWVIVLAVVTGFAFVALFFGLMQILLKLQKDNTFRIEETIGKVADVYLSIPAEKNGHGKIQISIRGSFHEIDAVTEGAKIATGAKVKITQVIDNKFVVAEKI
jgi:membrane protein implicated in regulation of membrane protease activity